MSYIRYYNNIPVNPAIYAVDGVIPSNIIDFTNDYYSVNNTPNTFDNLVTFSRASSATYLDESKILTTAATNEPRFDYSNGRCEYLHEESSTNLMTYSEDFAFWPATGVTVTANAATGPDGTDNFTSLTKDATGFRRIERGFTASTGVPYTASVYVQAGTNDEITLLLTGDNAATVDGRVVFNLTSLTVTSVGSANLDRGYIEHIRGDIYRVVLVVTELTANSNPKLIIYPDNYNQSNAGNVYVFGAQVEQASHASSYIATDASTATRAVDNFYIENSTAFAGVSGTIVLQATPLRTGASNVLSSTIGTATADTHIINIDSSSNLQGRTLVSSSATASLSTGAITAGTQYKIAYAFNTDDFRVSRDGAAVVSDNSGASFTGANRLYLGRFSSVDSHISQILYFDEPLTDAQLVNASFFLTT